MIAAYQGIAGAFGHQACRLVFPDAEATPCASFAEVVRAVADGRVEAGVLPVENHYAGPVDGVAELIGDSGLAVERFVDLPVQLHLLALPGADVGTIRTAVSHPMALRQCTRSLALLNVETVEAANTAMAAQSLGDRATAALASELAAELYGLQILMRDMQDDPDNRTTFAVIRRR